MKKVKLPEPELKNKEIDHIQQNIELSGKINKIRDIQLFYRNYVRADNID